MFNFSSLAKVLEPTQLNSNVLETAYELYLAAAQESFPVINLKELSERTGASLIDCRNTIVTANKMGRFPKCSLSY
jgi:hypothetical protein